MSYQDDTTVRSLRILARPRTLLQSTEYYAHSRKRTPQAMVSLDVQKPKPQASIENKIKKFHKQFDVYNTMHKNYGVGALR